MILFYTKKVTCNPLHLSCIPDLIHNLLARSHHPGQVRGDHLGDHMLVHTREYENCSRTRSEVVYSYLYCVLLNCSINTKHSFIFSHTHMYKCCGCYTCSVVGDICEPKKYTCFFMKSVYMLYRLNALDKYFFSRIKFYTVVLMDCIYADLISSLSHLSINKLEKRYHFSTCLENC